jgi:hypothetical protein
VAQERNASQLSDWELRTLRRLVRKANVLEGMIDEYEQTEARRRVFGDLWSDARGTILFLVAVLGGIQTGVLLFLAFHH